MTARRLPEGGRINRKKVVGFSWDGESMTGFDGDTLASALLANNQRVLGRSFKYHRPRGIMSAGVEESGATVTVGEGARREPNVKATTQELYQGLVATGQNAWPNVRYDIGSVNNLIGRFLSAGFYYKTFMGPRISGLPKGWGSGAGFWMQCEKLIRRAAGMGTASRQPDPDSYDHAHGFCDVLVAGTGPAGLSAALVCAKAGLDVLLAEQDCEPGGDFLNQPDGESEKQRAGLVAKLEKAGVRVMTRTTVFGLYDYGTAGLLERVTDHIATPGPHSPRQRFWTIRARQTILSTGAIERQIAFGNNDLPGVMTASAGVAYLHRYGILPGQKIVVATNNDSAYSSAAALSRAGASVTLHDVRTVVPESMLAMLGDSGVGVDTRCAPLKARGSGCIRSLDIAAVADPGWVMKGSESCDLALVSGGWSPVVNLISHRGVKPVWNQEQACFVAPECSEPIYMAGAAAGVWNTDACIESGRSAGARAARQLGCSTRRKAPPKAGGWENPIQPLYEVRAPGMKLKSLVDPQHDVTTDDVRLAHREGFVSVEHLKRYTTLGMATDGGKVGNIIGLALMAGSPRQGYS